ncbi:SDR family NAD(P)-dependent oxidoreductase [Donghicola tyrosinivorans]|uniref:NAD(P)-dependent dehydrogenase (Short-subunit alcohol dehydrogenase family) n=1 Tax=Donghicola tyrosinivorans TaxID=1652492 RepID=A0A2T0WDS8_9RHOB|nr:SDR family NAD(P)-dependent oxidoreductase [Donghicola tyrosinivorans]PRY84825.1 NAD(P)-dependent dehydrogenase (short-subunit alcohol dehydrogenase family) [Donghicola tyrosinivorans]
MYLDKFKLTGQRALVTGAARGIGAAIAEALAEAGAHVILTDLGTAAEPTAQALRDKGYSAEAAALDVTDRAAVDALAETVGALDVLVNNAGIAISNHPAEDMTDEVWNKVLDVNLNGTFWCCRAFGKRMLARGKGSIVNIGSMSADIVNRPQEQVNYNASKAAVHHLTRSLAAEWGERGVRVNAVAPTYIETDMNTYVYENEEMYRHWIGGTPMARMGKPEEVASVVLFLAGQGASLMTGAIVLADGGYTCW